MPAVSCASGDIRADRPTSGRPVVRGLPDLGRTRVIGVVNVTPDSFSDGGDLPDAAAAIEAGLRMLEQGADAVDVGGESTRPGAARVPEELERQRVLPVVQGLAAAGAVVSVDTMRASVAAAAVEAGAQLVNDVSGGLADPAMLRTVAAAQVPYVVMHWRGASDRMQELARYGDVVADVRTELRQRLDAADAAGIDLERVVLDPGLGFAKTAEHNWALLRALPGLGELGRPLLVGASRKAFLGALLAAPDGSPRPPKQRDAATAAVSVLAAQAGAWAVRVHRVGPSVDAVRVAAEMGEGRRDPAQPVAGADVVRLRGLRVRGRHGVLPAERRDGQDFVVDAELRLDVRDAAARDDLARTVDYSALAADLAAVVAGEPVRLLETLATRLAQVCLARDGVRSATVTVHKPAAPIPLEFDDVSVTVTRP